MKKILKWFFGLLLLGTLVLIGLFVYTLLPQNIEIPESAANVKFAPHLVNTNNPPAVSLSIIKSGKMISKQIFSWRGGKFGEEYQSGMAAILVKHPKATFLFDTGFGEGVDEHLKQAPWLMQKLARVEKEAPVAKQLLAAGITQDKISAIYLSHSHWDHVSGLDGFPGIEVRMPAAELEFVRAGKVGGIINSMIGNLNVKTYQFADRPYENFDRSYDLFEDGSVVFVPLPGHTDGSNGMFVNLPSGKRFFFIGDLTWAIDGIELPAERPWLARKLVDYDDETVCESIIKVHQLMKKYPEMMIVPAHDRRVHEKIKAFPEFEG